MVEVSNFIKPNQPNGQFLGRYLSRVIRLSINLHTMDLQIDKILFDESRASRSIIISTRMCPLRITSGLILPDDSGCDGDQLSEGACLDIFNGGHRFVTLESRSPNPGFLRFHRRRFVSDRNHLLHQKSGDPESA